MGDWADGGLVLFDADQVVQPHLIPMEANLDGWPLFSRQKGRKRGDTLRVSHKVATGDGNRVEQLWQASALPEFCLPGPFDEDVFVGVMALVKRRGGMPADGRIRFSTYELIQVMGKTKRSGMDAKVRESLDRIGATVYLSKNAFYVAQTESLESYRFTLWTVHLSKATGSDGRGAEHHTLKFDDIIVRSYNSGYLRLLDTELYLKLGLPLAKALYRLVNVRRGQTRSWSVEVMHLRDLLGMSRSYRSPSKVWEILGPGISVLRRERFLEGASLSGETARFVVHPEYARDWLAKEADAAVEASEDGDARAGAPRGPKSLADQAVDALANAGVWRHRAKSLVERFGPEKAFHALAVFEAMGAKKVKKNAGGYLAEMVENGEPGELSEMAESIEVERGRAADQPSLLSEEGDPDIPEAGAIPGEEAAPVIPEDPAAAELLELVLEDAAEELDASSLLVWFGEVYATGAVGERLTIASPSGFAKEYVETRFGETIAGALRERGGEGWTLEVVVGRRG